MKNLLPALFCFLLVSCDPVFNIGLINTTSAPVQVDVLTTASFQSDTSMVLTVTPGKDSTRARFVIQPGDTVICGMAIAEINNDLPFTEMRIYKQNGDSIVAENEQEVLDFFGPYSIIGTSYLKEIE